MLSASTSPAGTRRSRPMASPGRPARINAAAARRKFSAEEKIRIVLEGLGGEETIAELCRREGIVANLYYRWSKEFLEAGKRRLLGDTQREASSSEVGELRKENARLKELVAETVLENRLLKKSVMGSDSPEAEA